MTKGVPGDSSRGVQEWVSVPFPDGPEGTGGRITLSAKTRVRTGSLWSSLRVRGREAESGCLLCPYTYVRGVTPEPSSTVQVSPQIEPPRGHYR